MALRRRTISETRLPGSLKRAFEEKDRHHVAGGMTHEFMSDEFSS